MNPTKMPPLTVNGCVHRCQMFAQLDIRGRGWTGFRDELGEVCGISLTIIMGI